MKHIAIVIASVFICSCGIIHGPGYSMNDKKHFMESPKIVKNEAGYKLVWRYGEMGFYFEPRCVVKKSRLLCSLQGVSSSGALAGKYGEIILRQRSEIDAIENNRVFWLEPDGTKIKIEINIIPGTTGDRPRFPWS